MTENQQYLLSLLKEELDNMCDTTYPELCAMNDTEQGRAYIERNVLALCSTNGMSVPQALAQLESSLPGPAQDELPSDLDEVDDLLFPENKYPAEVRMVKITDSLESAMERAFNIGTGDSFYRRGDMLCAISRKSWDVAEILEADGFMLLMPGTDYSLERPKTQPSVPALPVVPRASQKDQASDRFFDWFDSQNDNEYSDADPGL